MRHLSASSEISHAGRAIEMTPISQPHPLCSMGNGHIRTHSPHHQDKESSSSSWSTTSQNGWNVRHSQEYERRILKTLYGRILYAALASQEIIITDNGKQFDNNAFRQFCDSLKIDLRFSAVGYPQCNGQAEVTNMNDHEWPHQEDRRTSRNLGRRAARHPMVLSNNVPYTHRKIHLSSCHTARTP